MPSLVTLYFNAPVIVPLELAIEHAVPFRVPLFAKSPVQVTLMFTSLPFRYVLPVPAVVAAWSIVPVFAP